MEQSTDQRREEELEKLLEKRATIQEWIAKLEEQRASAPERILQRVRADYETRLVETTAALSHHVDAIRSQLERAIEAASVAERESEEASDALEEGRLRHAIGEVPAIEWEEQQRQLIDTVERARGNAEHTSQEVERLRDLLGRLEVADRARRMESPEEVESALAEALPEEPVTPAEPIPAAASAETAIPSDAWEDPDATVESWEVAEAVGEGESEAFLAEIDRALTENGGVPEEADAGDPALVPTASDEEPNPETAPKPGLKCGECGYTNDLSAWFCGVCGADIG